MTQRFIRRFLVWIALVGLVVGTLLWLAGQADWSNWIWAAGTLPVIVGLAVSMIRSLFDGINLSLTATLDEAALTGEPIPVTRSRGEAVRSGTINAGDTFELQASANASESTYAGIVRMVTAAQSAKAPFIRIADRYALILLPATLLLAGAAWLWTGNPIRGLAVLVTSTPCPLILAARCRAHRDGHGRPRRICADHWSCAGP